MKYAYLFIAFYCAVSLTCSDGKRLVERTVEDNFIPSSGEENPDKRFRVDAVESIKLSIRKPWEGDHVVNLITKEIHMNFGKTLEQRSPIHEFYTDFFNELSPQRLNFSGEGIAEIKYELMDTTRTLKVQPKMPGTFHFYYGGVFKNGTRIRGDWTVYSVPSFPLRRGSFFKIKLDFAQISVTEDVEVLNLNNIGVDAHSEPGVLSIYGLAEDIREETILTIEMKSADSSTTSMKVRLVTKDSAKESSDRALERVKVWVERDLTTIQDRKKFAACVSSSYQVDEDALELVDVSFTKWDTSTTMFRARRANVHISRQKLGGVRQSIQECDPMQVIGYSLLSSEGYSDERLPGEGRSSDNEIVDSFFTPTTSTKVVTEISTIASVLSTSSSTAVPASSTTSSSTAAPIVSTTSTTEENSIESGRSENSVETEPNVTQGNQMGSYSSLTEHIQYHALVWLVIFIILFLLIIILSR